MNYFKYAIYIAVICAILWGGWFLFRKKNEENIYNPNLVTLKNTNLSTETDTDDDGLKDWEEILWKTDPNKEDTDGDNTSDAEEIKINRDPTIKGPADKLTRVVTSQTSELAENLFGYYLNTRKTEGDILPGVSEKIVENALKEASKPREYNLILEKDLSIIKTNTLESHKKYGKDLATSLSFMESNVNEIQILAVALESKEDSDIASLDPAIKSYREVLSKMIEIQVPSELSSKHLKLINATIKVITDIEAMRGLFSDSLLALSAVTSYSSNISELELSLKEIGASLRKKGVKYSTDEIGYGLINVL